MNSQRKAKIKWQSRRGMLELDLILGRFIETQLDEMSESQLDAFEKLLKCIDPELFSWLMGYSTPIEKELATIVEYIRQQDVSR
ncbi:MAG: succinate dehydrogenase assembly factor 2 [Tatlockia sp.]|nr:succinate dehydrogenase assembly factor 2 [Tatlockia sp.]